MHIIAKIAIGLFFNITLFSVVFLLTLALKVNLLLILAASATAIACYYVGDAILE